MKKEDQELFALLGKVVHYPIVLLAPKKGYSCFADLLLDTHYGDIAWSKYYPVNQDKMLISFVVLERTYLVEVGHEQYQAKTDSYFELLIRNEIKQIMSKKEAFYFSKLTPNLDEKSETNRLEKLFSTTHKKAKAKKEYLIIDNDKYVILSVDKAHLCRTEIFIVNSIKK